jgi:membrane-associated protein
MRPKLGTTAPAPFERTPFPAVRGGNPGRRFVPSGHNSLIVFDWIESLVSDSPWTYPLVLVITAFDAFFPLVPSETAIITGGILAANGSLSLPLVIPWLIVVARFLPGGRTATTFAAGFLDITWRRFIVYDGAAAVLWSIYVAAIGSGRRGVQADRLEAVRNRGRGRASDGGRSRDLSSVRKPQGRGPARSQPRIDRPASPPYHSW